MLPRRLHIGNERYSRRKFIKVCEVQGYANSFGNGNQVQDVIGGSSYGGVDHDRIFKGFSGKDLVHGQVLLDHLHNAQAGEVSHYFAAGVRCRNGGIVR